MSSIGGAGEIREPQTPRHPDANHITTTLY